MGERVRLEACNNAGPYRLVHELETHASSSKIRGELGVPNPRLCLPWLVPFLAEPRHLVVSLRDFPDETGRAALVVPVQSTVHRVRVKLRARKDAEQPLRGLVLPLAGDGLHAHKGSLELR